MNYSSRRYLVIPTSIIGQIDFNQVLETSTDTLRKSIDETLTFVKYNVELDVNGNVISGRPSIYDSQYQEYNYNDILTLLSGPDWTSTEEV